MAQAVVDHVTIRIVLSRANGPWTSVPRSHVPQVAATLLRLIGQSVYDSLAYAELWQRYPLPLDGALVWLSDRLDPASGRLLGEYRKRWSRMPKGPEWA